MIYCPSTDQTVTSQLLQLWDEILSEEVPLFIYVQQLQTKRSVKSRVFLKFDNYNFTLAARSGFDLHRYRQVLSHFVKKIEKNLASAPGHNGWP